MKTVNHKTVTTVTTESSLPAEQHFCFDMKKLQELFEADKEKKSTHLIIRVQVDEGGSTVPSSKDSTPAVKQIVRAYLGMTLTPKLEDLRILMSNTADGNECPTPPGYPVDTKLQKTNARESSHSL